jgi:uncharacterized protein (UPF0332 family)
VNAVNEEVGMLVNVCRGDYGQSGEITAETAQKSIDRAIDFLNAVKDYLSHQNTNFR